jgi:2-methylcitrate dehydratase PrpD
MVTVTLDDGRVLSHNLRYPKGHPRNPFSWEETEDLFRYTVKHVLDQPAADRIIQLVRDLEQQSDLHELANLLMVEGRALRDLPRN